MGSPGGRWGGAEGSAAALQDARVLPDARRGAPPRPVAGEAGRQRAGLAAQRVSRRCSAAATPQERPGGPFLFSPAAPRAGAFLCPLPLPGCVSRSGRPRALSVPPLVSVGVGFVHAQELALAMKVQVLTLFYFIPFYLVLVYFIPFYLVLFCFIPFYLVLFYLFHFIWFYFILLHFILFYFNLFYLIFLPSPTPASFSPSASPARTLSD